MIAFLLFLLFLGNQEATIPNQEGINFKRNDQNGIEIGSPMSLPTKWLRGGGPVAPLIYLEKK